MGVKIFVNSPFQVICAAELLHARPFDVTGHELVVMKSGSQSNVSQTIATARELNLDFREFPFDAKLGVLDKFRRWRLFLAEVRGMDADDVLVVGNPTNDLFADALAGAAVRDKWVLDEGIVSVRFLAALAGAPAWAGLPRSRLSRWLTRAPAWPAMKWFSIFGDYFPALDNVVTNRFERLRSVSAIESCDSGGDVLFLGQPLVSAGLCDEQTYVDLIERISGRLRSLYPGRPLAYARHRSEDERDALAHAYFDTVEPSSGPIELRWLNADASLPIAIAGTLSTALFSLAELFNGAAHVHAFLPGTETRVKLHYRDPAGLVPVFHAAGSAGKMMIENF